jgi:tetratricopeptide (TPR) repeat protein
MRCQICQLRSAPHRAGLISSSLRSSIAGLGLFGAFFILIFACAAFAQGPNPQQLFQEALAAQQRGDAALAVSKYQELIRLHPEMTAARANLGIVLVSLGRFDEAIEQYRAALQQAPDSRALLLNLALAYYKKGDFPSAAGQFRSLQEAEPGNVRIATLLGHCYVRLGHDDEAISLLTPFEKAHADDLDLEWALGSALIRSGRTQEGLDRVEKVAQQGHSAEAYALAADAYMRLNLVDQARRDLDEALRLNPHLPGLHTLSGAIMDYSGDQEGAALEFQKALAANPNDFEAQVRLGALRYAQRKLDAAKLHLNRALEIDPLSSLALYMLARVERAKGQLDAAVRDLEKAAQVDPDWLPPHIELAALYYRLKRPEDGAREKKIVDRLSADEQQHKATLRIITPTLPSH